MEAVKKKGDFSSPATKNYEYSLEPANFLAAPAPDFFFKRLRLSLLIFFPSGSGS